MTRLDWSGFLARPSVASPPPDTLDVLRAASILVVGAGGSIGSALALRLAALAPRALVLLDASEGHLYALQRAFAEAGVAARAAFYLAGVADRAPIEEIFAVHAPRLVFHAAAFKHAPFLEEQPFAAIENNLFGTMSLLAAATGARMVLLSTDKAAEPVSIMGATKRVAEHVVLASGGNALRLGNVLGSRDSVAEIFTRQIAAGGPLTVTDPAARRYFLTVEEAVNLLLYAAVEPESPTLFAPALPQPHTVVELARFMAQVLAPELPISIDFTGLLAGEKQTEQFWSASESVRPASSTNLLRIDSPLFANAELRSALAALRSALDGRDLRAALALLRRLVPDYSPSSALLTLAGRSAVPVVA